MAEKKANLSEDEKSDEDDEIGTIYEKLDAESEKAIIDHFLGSFVLDSDSGSKVDQIDIKLALKAIPGHISE